MDQLVNLATWDHIDLIILYSYINHHLIQSPNGKFALLKKNSKYCYKKFLPQFPKFVAFQPTVAHVYFHKLATYFTMYHLEVRVNL